MADFDVDAFIESQIHAVKEALGDEKAIVACSGGVDSTVSALITHRAIGDNLICIFIDDNFMRLGEAENIRSILSSEPLNLPVRVVNERQRFMQALEGLSDAEEKRKAFRKTFYETLSDISKSEEIKFLVQGTIKADIDETAAGIKTQHNILEQIGIDPVERFGYTVIEPMKSLYKYQVREVARAMSIPPELAERQPFPGPGLSIRVVGEITAEKLEELKKATFIVEESFEPHNPSQFLAAIFSGLSSKDLKVLKRDAAEITGLDSTQIRAGFMNEKATGMFEGKRAYGSVITIAFRDPSERPLELKYEDLSKILSYLKDNYPEATRLLYLIDDKDRDGYAIALRAIKTRDFLTAKVMELQWATLQEAAAKILNTCASVSSVYYDVTPKPPATVEYE
ncbi:MAG: GMP synthase [Candidatus Bathyarchaeota archaeon]|nr:GMP synthase [Candidatus Bathyarchaeota archaeon]